MSTQLTQAGPGKRRKPRRNDSPPAAPRQEERELSPTSVYRNGSDEGEQTPSDTKSDGILVEQTGPADGGKETHSQVVGAEFQDQDYLIAIKEVERRTGSCRSTINYLMRYSDFPLPLKLGVKMNRWWSGEVNRWLRSRPRAKGDLGQWHSRVEGQD